MDFNILQIILVGIVAFIVAIDQFSFLESLYQPIVTGAVIGLILGDLEVGLVVGGTYQLMSIGNMPVGGAQPPNAVIGGIMATVFAISSKLAPEVAVGLAVPFALLGQYAVTLIFTISSVLMERADVAAKNADPSGIAKVNFLSMGLLGLFFAIVCILGLVGGSALGETLDKLAKDYGWVMAGLGAAGKMMKYVGFAILLKIMLSNELWGIYLAGFAVVSIIGLTGPTLLLVAFIGAALAIYDYQTNVRMKKLGVAQGPGDGGDEDGI